MGSIIDSQARQSIVSIWRYVGHIMGVPESILFTNEHEARQIYEIGHLCEPSPDEDAIRVANTVFKAIPAMSDLKTDAERKSLEKYAYRLSRALIGNKLADQFGYPNTIRSRFLVLLYFKAKSRVIGLLTKKQMLTDKDFTQIFEATQYDRGAASVMRCPIK